MELTFELQDYYTYACGGFNKEHVKSQVFKKEYKFVHDTIKLIHKPEEFLGYIGRASFLTNEDKKLASKIPEYYQSCFEKKWQPISPNMVLSLFNQVDAVEKDIKKSFAKYVATSARMGVHSLVELSVQFEEDKYQVQIQMAENEFLQNVNCIELVHQRFPSLIKPRIAKACEVLKNLEKINKKHHNKVDAVDLDISQTKLNWSDAIAELLGLHSHCQKDNTVCHTVRVYSSAWWTDINQVLNTYDILSLNDAILIGSALNENISNLKSEGKEKSLMCQELTMEAFEFLIHRILYLKSSRSKTEPFLTSLIAELKETLSNLISASSVPDKEKNYALYKIKGIRVQMGYPTLALDLPKLQEFYGNHVFDPNDMLHSLVSKNTVLFKIISYHIQNANTPDLDIFSRIFYQDSFPGIFTYRNRRNSIFLYLSNLDEGLMLKTPEVLSRIYASIGTIVAHELSHSIIFDNLLADLKLRPTLVEQFHVGRTDMDQIFEIQQGSCLINHYNSLKSPEGATEIRVNGRLTLTENIADVIGFRTSLEAWKRKDSRPSLLPFTKVNQPSKASIATTPLQQFILAYAQTWCDLPDPSQKSKHAPSFARVNGVLQSSVIFEEAYPECKQSTPMNPAKKCIIF